MTVAQITARVPDEVAAAQECYLEDFDDLTVALVRLRDPSDPVLDWDDVRRELLDTDQEQRPSGVGATAP